MFNLDAKIREVEAKKVSYEVQKDVSQRTLRIVENQRTEEKVADKLWDVNEAESLAAADQPLAVDRSTRPTKKRKSMGRTVQIKTRLTETEERMFQQRVEKAGLSRGAFVRKAILEGQILIEDTSMANISILDELALIRAELGRQGGLLKVVIKPNLRQREFAPEEWSQLITTIRDFESIKKQLFDLEVKLINGHNKA